MAEWVTPNLWALIHSTGIIGLLQQARSNLPPYILDNSGNSVSITRFNQSHGNLYVHLQFIFNGIQYFMHISLHAAPGGTGSQTHIKFDNRQCPDHPGRDCPDRVDLGIDYEGFRDRRLSFRYDTARLEQYVLVHNRHLQYNDSQPFVTLIEMILEQLGNILSTVLAFTNDPQFLGLGRQASQTGGYYKKYLKYKQKYLELKQILEK